MSYLHVCFFSQVCLLRGYLWGADAGLGKARVTGIQTQPFNNDCVVTFAISGWLVVDDDKGALASRLPSVALTFSAISHTLLDFHWTKLAIDA
jgi:hypothetical protein